MSFHKDIAGILTLIHQERINLKIVTANSSASDLFRTVSEANELSEGAFVHFNVDNDNDNNNVIGSPSHPGGDYLDDPNVVNASEDDMKDLSLTVSPNDLGSIELTASGEAKIWKSSSKGSGNLVIYQGSKTWNLSDPNERTEFTNISGSLYVEGVGATGSVTSKWKDPQGNAV